MYIGLEKRSVSANARKKVIKHKLGTCPTHHDGSILILIIKGFDK